MPTEVGVFYGDVSSWMLVEVERSGCFEKTIFRYSKEADNTIWISDSHTAGFPGVLGQLTVTRVALFVQRVVMKTTLHSPRPSL